MGNTRNLGDLLNTDSTIATADVADGGITTAKLADTAVTTAKITDANITTAKLASNAVTTAKITDGNISTAKLADDAVTQAKIGADAVGTTELANDVAISTSGAITTTGAFTSLGIDDNADGTAITIDSSEQVGIGTTSPATKLDVSDSGADYVATFQNTTSATGYGVLIKEPLNASAGYPLLAITDGQANTVRFRVDSSTGHIGVNRSPTSNDTIHINDTQPIIKLEETSSGGSKMLQMGVESDGTPFISAPQSGAQIEVQLIGNPEFQYLHGGRFRVTRTGVPAYISRGPVTGVTVENGSTTSVAGMSGVLHNIVLVSDGSGNGGSFAMSYTTGVTKLAGSGNYTTTQNTTSSTNIYKSGSSHAVTLQNNTGSDRSYFILILASYD